MSEMTPAQVMQHELKCRRVIIDELMVEKERILEMVNRANTSCHRLRDEVIFVTAQTHAVVKAMMIQANQCDVHIPAHMMKKAAGYILEVGEKEESDEDGTLRFSIREHTDKEKEVETQLRAKIEGAEKRIIQP